MKKFETINEDETPDSISGLQELVDNGKYNAFYYFNGKYKKYDSSYRTSTLGMHFRENSIVLYSMDEKFHFRFPLDELANFYAKGKRLTLILADSVKIEMIKE